MPRPVSRHLRVTRKPASRYHHGDLRRALIQEAVRTIGRDGVEALTLREVGSRLGVSRTALYRHFSDKTGLLAAVAREGFQRFRQALVDAWESGGRTPDAFEAMGAAYVRFAIENPAHYRVMFGRFRDLCGSDSGLSADASAAFQVLVDAIAALQETGAVCRDDPRQLALFVWATVHGVATLAIDGQLGPSPETGHPLVHFAMRRMATGIAGEVTEISSRSSNQPA